MPIVYYIGGPADLTKRAHSERLFSHDHISVPITQPVVTSTYRNTHIGDATRFALYRLQQIGTTTFIAIYDRDSP